MKHIGELATGDLIPFAGVFLRLSAEFIETQLDELNSLG